eukprot:Hpha_TRINITY_DN16394_c1_g1::TRINITY_DN16394_c1_g1_i2::g.58933::m.58933
MPPRSRQTSSLLDPTLIPFSAPEPLPRTGGGGTVWAGNRNEILARKRNEGEKGRGRETVFSLGKYSDPPLFLSLSHKCLSLFYNLSPPPPPPQNLCFPRWWMDP